MAAVLRVGTGPSRRRGSAGPLLVVNFPRTAAALGRSDDAVLLKEIDQSGGARVTDAQAALEQRGRDARVLARDLGRALVQVVSLLVEVVGAARELDELLDVTRRPEGAPIGGER